MPELTPTERTTLVRHRERGSYDRAVIHEILDEAFVCHVGFVSSGQPHVLPMAHARLGERLYVHGAVANRMLVALANGGAACVTVTILDGLVLARSAFHHSMNYRSAVIYGRAERVVDEQEKRAALEVLVNRMAPERASLVRAPSAQELAATLVLAIPIVEASAKVRRGPPIDAERDLESSAWAGVIPLRTRLEEPVRDVRTGKAAAGTSGSELTLSTDRARLDRTRIHRFLSEEAYWSRGVARDVVERSIDNSLCVGMYDGANQIAFARVVTDRATFAYLCDVFVLPPYRGRGVASRMLEHLLAEPDLRAARRWMLGTRDAHALYARQGFAPLARPERFMERHRPYEASANRT